LFSGGNLEFFFESKIWFGVFFWVAAEIRSCPNNMIHFHLHKELIVVYGGLFPWYREDSDSFVDSLVNFRSIIWTFLIFPWLLWACKSPWESYFLTFWTQIKRVDGNKYLFLNSTRLLFGMANFLQQIELSILTQELRKSHWRFHDGVNVLLIQWKCQSRKNKNVLSQFGP